jgi:sec-independent protein translocase protein TatC
VLLPTPTGAMFFRFLLQKLFGLRKKKEADMVKPFLEHLEDLRWMLLKMVVVLGASMVLCFAFRFDLAHVVEEPLRGIMGEDMPKLQTLSPADSVSISMTLAFSAGIIIAFPLLLYFLLQFVLPALSAREKRYLLPAISIGFGLFLAGAFFCFKYILPATLHWLYYDSKHMGFAPDWRANAYFSFATQFVLIFGLMFELPVVIMGLIKMGLLEASTLRRTRAYAFVIILVAAMIIAPTPDPITMGIVAGPMLVLYELCIWLAWGLEQREKRLAMRPTRRKEDAPEELP